MKMASRKHDVIAVLISDPREMSVPPVGLLDLLDPETGQTTQLDTYSSTARSHFQKHSQRRVEDLEESFKAAKIDFIHVDISKSVVDPLALFFRMRAKRGGRS